jgi:hypothetical protein
LHYLARGRKRLAASQEWAEWQVQMKAGKSWKEVNDFVKQAEVQTIARR